MLKSEAIQMLDDAEEILSDDQLTDSQKVDQLEGMFFEPEEGEKE